MTHTYMPGFLPRGGTAALHACACVFYGEERKERVRTCVMFFKFISGQKRAKENITGARRDVRSNNHGVVILK